MSYLYNSPSQKTLRQKLRKQLGLPEALLWNLLKQSRLGKKFRRQYGVGQYVLDFYCPELRLGIELDGSSHDNPQSFADDQARDKTIAAHNIRTLRFLNNEVLNNLDGVVAEIRKYL